jgi:hypothetical protein
MDEVPVPPWKIGDNPNQKCIDEINETSSLSSNAEFEPLRRLSLYKSDPTIIRQKDGVNLEDNGLEFKISNSPHDSSPLSPDKISSKKNVRFKEPSPSFDKSNTETITKDGNLDVHGMFKRVSGE